MKVSEYNKNPKKMFTVFSSEKDDYGIGTLYTEDDVTNCKLSYLHGIGVLSNYSKEQIKEVIEEILPYLKGTVLLNTTSKAVFTKLKEIFKYYYANEVPIGYNNGFQYHILIKNEINPNQYCRTPDHNKSTKESIKNKLLDTLKRLRRKDDYVNDFINSLEI